MSILKRAAAFILMFAASLALIPHAGAYESLAYLYGGTTAAYVSLVTRTNGNLTSVSPDYFETGAGGEIKYTKPVDQLLLADMRSRGITVLPFLSNHWDRDKARAMLKNRTVAALTLAEAVKTHKLDGLDIDIQNNTPDDKADFTDFIKLLRAAMPSGSRLTVCVPANPYFTDKGWQGAYDYAEITKHCDHVFMMTYDESYDGSAPGPVASYWFIENAIKYGLQYVPKEKLMIGIPLYGRFWTDTIKGAAFTTADIAWLVENTDCDVWYDEAKDCARATVRIPAGTTVTTWGGRKISAGVYDIWYDNERSYEKKLSLVRQYGLRGAGMWALGQEPASVWNRYAVWLGGYVFTDVRDHWAMSYITDLKDTGIITGKTDTTFDPEGLLTRAEAAVMLLRLAGITPGVGAPFDDTKAHWARDYIAAARANGLVNGMSDTLFYPDLRVSREEFAAMADRYTSLDDTFDMTDSGFTDVTPEGNPWSIKSIIKMNINGVISGYPNGEFRPRASITRAEAAKMISLVSKLPTRFLRDRTLPLQKSPMSPR